MSSSALSPHGAAGAVPQEQVQELERQTIRIVAWRLMPLVVVLYLACNLDRANLSYAALTMNRQLGLSALAYGWGAGIFFWGYFLFEVPSNLMLERVGARRWIARIMLSWGVISGLQVFVAGTTSFLVLRFLLGAAEAGFVPGIILYVTYWFPQRYRARAIAVFLMANPLSNALGGLLAGPLLAMDGVAGLSGWQWMFLLEALPPILLAFVVLRLMPDRPRDAPWLSPEQSGWLVARLGAERAGRGTQAHARLGATLLDLRVLLLSAIYFGRTTSMFGIAFFLPQLVKGLGFSNGATGVVSAIPYVAAILGMLAWAHFSDRAADRRWHLIGTHVAAALGLAAAAWMGASLWSLVAITVAAVGFSAQPGCFWPLPPMLLGPTAAASGIAMVNALGNLGGFAGPWGVGLITSHTGNLNDGLYFLAVCPALSGLLVLLVPSVPRAAVLP